MESPLRETVVINFKSRRILYAYLNFITQTENAPASALMQQIEALTAELGRQTVFFWVEWNQLPDFDGYYYKNRGGSVISDHEYQTSNFAINTKHKVSEIDKQLAQEWVRNISIIRPFFMSENKREQPYQYAQADIAKPALRIEDMPQYAQNIYHQGKECFVDFCRHENIHYREEDLDRIGMSMAAAGYAQGLRGVSLIDVDERTREISIAHESPNLNEAVVNMDKAAVTPTAKSLNQIQQTEQQFEYETQQRQLAQSQSRGMVLS